MSVSLCADYFKALSEVTYNSLQAQEEASLSLVGEDSEFIRFNALKVRQATFARQRELSLCFQREGRSLNFTANLTGDLETDAALMGQVVKRLRDESEQLPVDPFQVPLQNSGTSEAVFANELPSKGEVLECLLSSAGKTDFAGLFASGPLVRAQSNSKGQRHYFETHSFYLDYSLYCLNENGENKASKGLYAGSRWLEKDWKQNIQRSLSFIDILKRPSLSIAPESYRAYLAPAAMSEIIALLGWNTLSYSAYKQGRSAFKKLFDQEARLSEKFTLQENFSLGTTPRFNSLGELSAEKLVLVEQGKPKSLLVSSRSANEYQVSANAAQPTEDPRALELLPGSLKEEEIIKRIDKGVFLSNLHYLNYSDLQAGRITGMTRYACFWVEGGELRAPIKDFLFDLNLYQLFGTDLEDLSADSHFEANTLSYSRRSLGGWKLPGALVRAFPFTL